MAMSTLLIKNLQDEFIPALKDFLKDTEAEISLFPQNEVLKDSVVAELKNAKSLNEHYDSHRDFVESLKKEVLSEARN